MSGIYLLVVLYAIIEGSKPPPEPMDNFALLILTAPFSFLLAILFESLGIMTKENSGSLIYLDVVFGGLVNASILYLTGILLTKVFKFLATLGGKS